MPSHTKKIVVIIFTECRVSPQKTFKFFRKDCFIFSKTIFEFKISFLLKFGQKYFFYTALTALKQFCENWQACNLFTIWLRMLTSFLNAVDKQLILKFINSFLKFCPVFPKIPKVFFVSLFKKSFNEQIVLYKIAYF